MTAKSKSLRVGCVTFVLTALVTLFKEFKPGYANGIWFIWAFVSWNYFAYAFDKRMWPSQFVELKGGNEGSPIERRIFFWGTAVVYLAFLATMAFAN